MVKLPFFSYFNIYCPMTPWGKIVKVKGQIYIFHLISTHLVHMTPYCTKSVKVKVIGRSKSDCLIECCRRILRGTDTILYVIIFIFSYIYTCVCTKRDDIYEKMKIMTYKSCRCHIISFGSTQSDSLTLTSR